MQPEDNQDQDWQQPKESGSQAPYQAPESDGSLAADTDSTEAAEGESTVSQSDDSQSVVRWQAAEYLQHEHTVMWYSVFGVVVVVLMALAIFLMGSVTFAVLVPVMAAALVVYMRRPPAPVSYTLSRKGLHVNDRLYTYDYFKSFSVVSHSGHHSAVLVPRKRFQMAETIYFPEEVGEPIVDMLAARLPMKDASPDLFDRLINRLKI